MTSIITGSIVAVGDSITVGGTSGVSWTTLVASDISVTVTANAAHDAEGWDHNNVGGTTGNTLNSRAATEVDIYVGSNPQPFLILFAGTNELFYGYTPAQTYTAFQTYIAARLAAGWSASKIIVNTTISRSSISDADRGTYNASLVTGVSTYKYLIARLDLDPRLGSTYSYADTTYFVDGVHPTAKGQQIIADVNEAVRFPAVKGKNVWRSL